jgi:CRISPR/Cas system-associated protein Csm6
MELNTQRVLLAATGGLLAACNALTLYGYITGATISDVVNDLWMFTGLVL